MYRREKIGLLKHWDFVLLDLICLQIAFILSFYIFDSRYFWGRNPYSVEIYRNMAILIECISFIVMYFNESFKNVLKRGYYQEFLQTVKHTIYVVVLCVFVWFIFHIAGKYSRLVFGFTFAIYTVMTYIVRLLWKQRVRSKRTEEGNRSLLVVTSRSAAKETIETVQRNNFNRYKINGVVLVDGTDTEEKTVEDIEIVATMEEAPNYVCQEWIDEVLVSVGTDVEYPQKMMNKIAETGVTIHLNMGQMIEASGRKQIMEKVAGFNVLTTSMNSATNGELIAKRIMDIAAGLIGCLITGILCIVFGPLIYIKSPGPIFFSQERVGRNGKKFKMYKFRSMYPDAEQRKADLMKDNKITDGKMFKMDFDPRVIGNKVLADGRQKKGIGQFMRDTSLDEFPQFWNVLKGDMSVVGTRPPLIGEVSLYELHHRSRLAIKPGITGMWQVNGRSDITDFEEVVKLDRWYIDNWTMGLDLRILFKTILVVFKREGSS